MDSTDSIIDPQAEVKKLQDLVKKLEKQNEFLRGRQKIQLEGLKNGETEPEKLTTNHNNNLPSTEKSWSKNVGGNSLEDIDVLDVDGLSLRDDEDSWWVNPELKKVLIFYPFHSMSHSIDKTFYLHRQPLLTFMEIHYYLNIWKLFKYTFQIFKKT